MRTMGKVNERGYFMAKKEYYEFDSETGAIEPVDESTVVQKLKGIDKWKLFKQCVTMAASGCASVVISKYLKGNMPDSANTFEKAVMGIGMYCITGVVSSAVAKYADEELDEWRDSIMMAKEVSDGGKAE